MSEIPCSSNTQQHSIGYEDGLMRVSNVKKFVEDMVGLVEMGMANQYVAPVTEAQILRVVAGEIKAAIKRLFPNAPGTNETEVQARRLCLQFTNKPKLIIYTGEEIKAEDRANIEVALVDASSGLVVESGPEAEAKMQVDLLEKEEEDDDGGPWSKIVRGRAGTKLLGKLELKLNRGIGIIDKIKLGKSSTPMKKGLFKLGASVLDSIAGIHIEEGKSESFTGKDCRLKYNMKSETPELSDPVWKLYKISRNKQIHKRLDKQGIRTVEDFLLQLSKDPEGLRRMWEVRHNDWEIAVKHARTCKLDQSTHFCIEPEKHNGVVQNKQVPRMVGECSSMNGGPPSAVHCEQQVGDNPLDEQSMGGPEYMSQSDIEENMRIWKKFEKEGIFDDQIDICRPEQDKPGKTWGVLIKVLIIGKSLGRSISRKRVCLEKPLVQKRQKIM